MEFLIKVIIAAILMTIGLFFVVALVTVIICGLKAFIDFGLDKILFKEEEGARKI